MKHLRQWAARTVLLAILGGFAAGAAYAEKHGPVAGLIVGFVAANGLAVAANLRRTKFVLGAETLVADLSVVPEVFLPYSVEQTAEKSELIKAGIIEMNDDFVRRADIGFDEPDQRGGQITNMPFWQDLTGEDEVISDTDEATTSKITSAADVAVIHNRIKAWSDNDMVGIIGGSDPAKAVGQLSGAFWERRHQAQFLAMLKGIFGHASMAANSHDIYLASGSTFTDANYLNGLTFIDARQKLGDVKADLTGAIMHSAVEANLEKNDLIDTVRDSEGREITFFQGLRVILDDTMTIEVINSANVYSTFLFGRGAVAFGVGRRNKPVGGSPSPQGVPSTWGLEWDRKSLAGQNIMIQRRRFILHMRGVKWNGSMAGLSPTNTELATSSNWLRVWEPKNVKVVRVRHNVEL